MNKVFIPINEGETIKSHMNKFFFQRRKKLFEIAL